MPANEDDLVTSALDAAREHYRIERERRLRTDGNLQYQELAGTFADLDSDPYVEPGFEREPITTSATAVIVGGGFAGMMTAVNLANRGIRDFYIVEKAGDFGGTWYWNRYPGCMCDVESYTYLPLLEETGYMPKEKYASAAEIFAYCQQIGRHFGLYERALFQTEIDKAVWNDVTQRWDITTSRNDVISSTFFVTAGGLLHKAKLPGIPGIEDFDGKMFHTSRWDYSFTGGSNTEPMERLAGLRVGIVGTGATGVQVVPQLAKTAKDLFVFQRTPSAVGVRGNGPTDESWFRSLKPGWQSERVENFTRCVTGEKPATKLVDDGWINVMWDNTQDQRGTPDELAARELLDFEIMEGLRERVGQVVQDTDTAERLKPWYGKHCKRITFHDDYLEAFNRDNVHLVDTEGQGIDHITANGPVVGGVEYPLDLLIFASGFEVTTDLNRRLGFDPIGRDGVAMTERWHDGAHTLHGIMTAEFPNMFIVSIVQAGFGTNFVHFLGKSAEHIGWLIETCTHRDIATIEPTVEAEESWLGELHAEAMKIAGYSTTCTPGYFNGEGQRGSARNLVYTGSLIEYNGHLERWRADGNFPGTTTSTK